MDSVVDRSGGAPAPLPACRCANERDRHLFCPGPKRLLALDGGGVRGAITVAFLEQIERVLSDRLGGPVRLADWFDLIGGTSTGAVIAGALAMGYTASDVKKFYLELAPKVFKRRFWLLRVLRGKAKFDADALRTEIHKIVGDRTLNSEDLSTGYCLIAKRMDTGSPWIISNNKEAPYWKTQTGKDGFVGNEHYPLVNLVRASTAAPFYFEPEWLETVEGAEPGLFVDGGLTPFNSPSAMLFLMTILKAYKICWKANPNDLTIVSVGTGSHRDRLMPEELGMGKTAKLTYRALMSLMNDIQTFTLLQMQYLGQCLTPWWINSEVKDLRGEEPVGGKMFRFLRYDVRLELKWIESEFGDEVEDKDKGLGRKLTETDIIRMRAMDDPTIIDDIYKLAQIAARKQVRAEHWLGDTACWCGGRRPSAKPHTMPPGIPEPQPAWFKAWLWVARRFSFLRSALVRAQRPPNPPKP
jgi:hypothetical protein